MSNELGKFLRERRGSGTLREFAARCGISHTHLDSIEKGCDPRTGKPVAVSVGTLRQIADGAGVSYLFLACLADGCAPEDVPEAALPLLQGRTGAAGSPPLSDEAAELALRCDGLDEHGRAAVTAVLAAEERRMRDETGRPAHTGTRVIPLFGTPFAAGPGEPDAAAPFEDYEVPASSRAEFAVRVTGNSMEPWLRDGQIALCSRRRPEVGDVAVMLVNGEFLVKQFITDGRNLYLRSLNRARSDADRDIWATGTDAVKCFGTVLLKKRPPLVR